ncbi:MAG TPA: hypothetical protein VGX23_26990 [Actinocrinis sp.]|nr:hypothetical protein [Actinocrinis sp.]
MVTPGTAAQTGPGAPGRGFEGEFETHVTVGCDAAEPSRLEALAAWAADSGVKLTHIMLGRGRVRSQPMLTLLGTGTLADQRDAAAATLLGLTEAGLRPTRVKVEAAPGNAGVPHTDEHALRLGREFYFEHHIKLSLTPDTDLESLAGLVIPHGAHLSWNARRQRAEGADERFVTQRCHGVGLPEAGSRLEILRTELRAHGYQILSTVQEFVVFDSDESLDAGWIDQPPPRPQVQPDTPESEFEPT